LRTRCGNSIAVIDSDGRVISESFFQSNNSHAGLMHNFIHNGYLGVAWFSAKAARSPFPFPKKVAMHDIWLGMTAAIAGKVVFLCLPLISYRRHGQNASTAFGTSQNSVLKSSFSDWNLLDVGSRGLNQAENLGPKIDVLDNTVCFIVRQRLLILLKSS